MRGARLEAVSAADALFRKHAYLGEGFIGLRVAAPLAAQRTALQEQFRPDPGAVVYGKSLHVYHIGAGAIRRAGGFVRVGHPVIIHFLTSNLNGVCLVQAELRSRGFPRRLRPPGKTENGAGSRYLCERRALAQNGTLGTRDRRACRDQSKDCSVRLISSSWKPLLSVWK